MAMTASCLNISSSCPPFHRTPSLCSRSISHTFSIPLLHFKKSVSRWGHALVQVKCVSKRGKEAAESEYENSSSTSSPSSSATVDCDDHTSISAYRWCVGLGGVGFLETAYLTYLKLRNTDAFCPMGGPSCMAILTSIPLPLFGMLAYGLVATLGLQLGAQKRLFNARSDGEII